MRIIPADSQHYARIVLSPELQRELNHLHQKRGAPKDFNTSEVPFEFDDQGENGFNLDCWFGDGHFGYPHHPWDSGLSDAESRFLERLQNAILESAPVQRSQPLA